MNPRRFLASCLAAVTVGFASSTFAAPSNPVAAVRDLGVQIKNAADRTSTGHVPVSSDFSDFERRIAALTVAQDHDPAFRQKLDSVARLLRNLKFAITHPAPVALRSPTRADVDIEQVTNTHGGTCASALGISSALPVRLTLAATGNDKGSAWFRYEARAGGHVRFATDSSSADPAIAVFAHCAAGVVATAQNDDAIDLDAATTVAVAAHQAIYVHLTNSGNGGTVTLSVADANAALTGTITDEASGQPIGGATIQLVGANFTFPGISATTDQNGTYTLLAPAGNYYVVAQASQHLLQVYPTASCPYNTYVYYISNCDLSAAQPIALSSGVTTSGIDLALSAGYVIAGQVRDDSNQTISQSRVTLYDSTGNPLTGTNADNFGRYSFDTIPPGSYVLAAQANGYGSQMFDHVACTGPLQDQCNLASASTLTISTQDATNVGFNLPTLPTIVGSVNGPGLQSSYYTNRITVLDSLGNSVAASYVDQSGNYRVGPLPSGDFHVEVDASGFFSQLYHGIDCAQTCAPQLAAAATVHVDNSDRIGLANFVLTPLPVVHGHVQDATTGAPLANVVILASITPPATFVSVSSTQTDANGDYALANVPAGQFYLWAQSADHIDQVYSGIPCQVQPSGHAPCSVTGAQLLSIAPGQTPGRFDFALAAASAISGRATIRTDTASDLPATPLQVAVYDDTGTPIENVNADANGNYIAGDLQPGTYFVQSSPYYYGFYNFVPQVWDQIDCPVACAPTTGTPIVVGIEATTTGVDFSLVAHSAIVGKVTDASSQPVPGILIDLFDPTSGNHITTAETDDKGFYSANVNSSQSYLVATDANGSYVDQVYSGISCASGPAYLGLCPLTNATAVTIGSNVVQPVVVNFVLQRPDRIFANGFE